MHALESALGLRETSLSPKGAMLWLADQDALPPEMRGAERRADRRRVWWGKNGWVWWEEPNRTNLASPSERESSSGVGGWEKKEVVVLRFGTGAQLRRVAKSTLACHPPPGLLTELPNRQQQAI